MISKRPTLSLAVRGACVAFLAAVSLSACSDVRRALGYDKNAPDEFAVVAHAPLSQPPDYTLRPPTPGAPRPQEGTVRDQAKGLVVASKTGGGSGAGGSSGEQTILAKAGVDKVDAEIRRKVNEETSALIEADKSFVDKILFWRTKDQPGEVLDAAKEAKRLATNAAQGKPVTAGESPQINRKSKGWLEDVF